MLKDEPVREYSTGAWESVVYPRRPSLFVALVAMSLMSLCVVEDPYMSTTYEEM